MTSALKKKRAMTNDAIQFLASFATGMLSIFVAVFVSFFILCASPDPEQITQAIPIESFLQTAKTGDLVTVCYKKSIGALFIKAFTNCWWSHVAFVVRTSSEIYLLEALRLAPRTTGAGAAGAAAGAAAANPVTATVNKKLSEILVTPWTDFAKRNRHYSMAWLPLRQTVTEKQGQAVLETVEILRNNSCLVNMSLIDWAKTLTADPPRPRSGAGAVAGNVDERQLQKEYFCTEFIMFIYKYCNIITCPLRSISTFTPRELLFHCCYLFAKPARIT